jgi:hypothetical protein
VEILHLLPCKANKESKKSIIKVSIIQQILDLVPSENSKTQNVSKGRRFTSNEVMIDPQDSSLFADQANKFVPKGLELLYERCIKCTQLIC